MTDSGTTTSHRFVFVGGLHRSGTSAFCRILGSDDRMAVFRNTGCIEDEGQFLQTVYRPDADFGGPGAFALDPAAKLDERSELVHRARTRLFREWAVHWDLDKPVLVEKSPANIIRSLFLQEVFPNSAFIFLMRHPVANCMATEKWNRAYVTTLMRNWIRAHDILLEDFAKIRNGLILRFEAFAQDPVAARSVIGAQIGISDLRYDCDIMKSGTNLKYYRLWKEAAFHLRGPWWKDQLKRMRNRAEIRRIERSYESRLNKFGYSFHDIDTAISTGCECSTGYDMIFRRAGTGFITA